MSAQQRVVALLKEHNGEFHAPDGNAGRLIAQTLGLPENTVFAALRRAELAGVIEREGGARRHYKIRLTDKSRLSEGVDRIPQPQRHLSNDTSTDDVEVDELAKALLRRVVAIEMNQAERVEEMHALRRKLAAAEEEITRLRGELGRLPVQVAELESERERLEAALLEARNEVTELNNRIAEQRRRGTRVDKLLSPEEKEALDQMMRERPTGR